MLPIDDDDALFAHPIRVMTCRLIERTALTTDIHRLVFRIESGGPFAFSAGQYARIEFVAPDGTRTERPYSIANAPSVSARDGTLEFHVRATAGSTVANLIAAGALEADEVLRITAPQGKSGLHIRSDRTMLMVAGGTGLGTMLSIAEEAIALGRRTPMLLYIGARSGRDVYGEAQVRALQQRHAELRVEIVLSEPESPTVRRTGLVTDALAHDLPQPGGYDIYLAGPTPMVEAAARLLVARGADPRDIHADDFNAEAVRP